MVSIESYGPHPLQSLKLFRFDPAVPNALVFIHGGAWRDPANTFDDFASVISFLGPLPVNLIGVNYRLSPKAAPGQDEAELVPFKHPLHLVDVVNAVSFIYEKLGQTKISLLGHSVGASFSLQLLNYDEVIRVGFERLGGAEPFANIDYIVFDKIVFVDGIFDVQKMLHQYGDDYRGFVDAAFVDERHYVEAFQTSGSFPPFKLIDGSTQLILVHSLDDELLSPAQTQCLQDVLDSRAIAYKLVLPHWGQHEEVYRRQELATLITELFA